ncbi:MAG: tetratricopeptide repeat protein [Steroidobacteraceae bacterium]
MSRRQARAAKASSAQRHRAGGPKPSPSTLQRAWALYAGGERAAAESLCRALLARQAGDIGAMSLLGILLAQSRRTQEAAELLEQVAARTPQDPAAHNNHGNVLRDLGRYLKALSCYDRAILIRPDYTEAHYNRGVTLHDLGRHDEALASYNRAVALEPKHASAWNNRGATLRGLGLREPAVESYDRAIAIRHGYPEAHNGRGVALQEIGRFEEALASYECAIASRPDYAEAHNNRGAVLRKLERPEEALASVARALVIRPDYAQAYNARGAVLKELERFEEALASFDCALGISPGCAEAYSNRGSVLRSMKRYPEALASYERALEIDPNFADAYRNQGAAFIDLKSFDLALASYERALALNQDMATYVAQGAVLHELKRTDEAIASYRRALALDPEAGFLLGTVRHVRMQICDWTDLEADVREIIAGLEADRPLSRPFNFLSLVDSPRLQRRASDLSVRVEIMPRRKLAPIPRHPRHERIRVGYFSADLRNHPVTILTAELFERHDRSRFDITAFSLGPNVRDEFRARIEPAFDRFLWVGGQSDREIAELSRRLEIDIAVDLGGYTGDARPRIMALRAAPVQVSYLGYLGTMGGDFMDYLIADPIIVPADARGHYAEKIAYLPSYQINDSKRAIADKVFSRAELGLPEAGFVFCCFNASYKITPEIFESWMRILAAVPGSVLFLLGGNDAKERNLRRQAAARGVAPDRLVFGGRVVNAEYLARYRSADLFLDTLPYNAGTTASDALWAGLPVLTCIGESFAARVAASILTSAHLEELVTPDLGQYEHLAIELALRPQRLAQIRMKLEESRATCPLFDTRTVTRNIESLYARMYDRHLAGLPPEHLELP